MVCKLCNDTGEQRYWEGRWRDERAENTKLRELLADKNYIRWKAEEPNGDAREKS